MKKIKISENTFIIILLLFSLFFLSMWGMQAIFPNIEQEKQADFVMELMKILFSSLLSAGVAYFVSVIQVKSANEKEKCKEVSTNQNRVRLLLIEIKDNKEVLSTLNKNDFPADSSKCIESQISKRVLNMYFDKLKLEENILVQIIKYDKKLSLFVTATSSDMKLTYDGLIMEIDNLIRMLDAELRTTKK
ncbi:hypothetical protein ACSVJ3_06075 [Enterococcus faecalis]|uniref:hypothetical protein n=1 Tax=Enterococcus faecalis TaxID=1351 RepID=UPI000DBB0F45|nr:hypothetical protein [Enterococcus faecalis]EJM6506450.1 hypothetical protein [Enterococcus faecalis]MCU2259609.1 hypothetical protein [Enterococcus faecalis]MDJ9034647.1 hypothetical protein [Enterococcus faecalis]BBD24807.1 hypothetical protein KUB3006_C12330 [Enterococcus faecalis]BBD27848.1 hypothetical protein KUB3007_C12310 [Enterococcus faecalis]